MRTQQRGKGGERMEGKLVQKSSHLSGSGGEGWSEPPSLLLAAIIRPFLPTPRTCKTTALAGHNNQEIRSTNKNIEQNSREFLFTKHTFRSDQSINTTENQFQHFQFHNHLQHLPQSPGQSVRNDSRDLWPLIHLIRAMRRHDLAEEQVSPSQILQLT